MPSMNFARASSSTYKHNENLYVFCGTDAKGRILQSMEKLKVVSSLSEQKQKVWKYIKTPDAEPGLTLRTLPVICPIDEAHILIMGGIVDRM